MKVVFLAMLISPLAVVSAAFPGVEGLSSMLGHLNPDEKPIALILSLIASIPSFVCAILLAKKKRGAILLFPFAFALVSAGPFAFEIISNGSSVLLPYLWGIIGISVGFTGYFYFSKESKLYFSNQTGRVRSTHQNGG